MKITKMSGAGNTFLIINAIGKEAFQKQNLPSLASKLCTEHNTDGLVLLKENTKVDFEWEFLNINGSHADMCGNAARCVVMYAFENKIAAKKVEFQAKNKIIKGEVVDNKTVKVFMGKSSAIDSLKVCGEEGLLIDSGVLHFVIEIKNINDLNLAQVASGIQKEPGPANNANITFFCRSDSNSQTNYVKTFERGVFKFTKACGTGAVAVGTALVFQKKHAFNELINLSFEGGILTVSVLDNYQDTLLMGGVETLDIFEQDLSLLR